MRFDILTLFPEAITPYLTASILGRAQETQHVDIRTWNIRDFATDKHKTVDDTPYGGGAGMVLKIEPIDAALRAAKAQNPSADRRTKIQSSRTVVLSARGEQFTQEKAITYAKLDQLILICGRYEGIDQRVIDHLADEEVSMGPYVLAGGEIPALAVLEATARLVPGVLGNPESLEDSLSLPSEAPTSAGRSWAQYTKPETYRGWDVPAVLRSGDHAAIEQWRQQHRNPSAT